MRSNKTETHNNLLILSRKWKLAVIFDIFIILALILTIYILINQNFTKIKYVEFGKKDNYAFRVLTSTIANEEKQLLIKQYLRDYVKFRESYEYGKKIDKRIVEKIRAISSDKVFKSYEVLQKTRDKISTFNKREIVILQDIEIENGRSHHVRYKTIDHYNGEKYENEWIMRIDYIFEKHRVRQKNELLNPFGLVIVNYRDDTILNEEDILNQK